ncbi:MAG: WbqC family protein [Cyanobacteria bacterium]|nr:WbqC family protein [Cyanobacteriota bacterium]
MKIAIMQPYFFPYLGYFQLIQAVDQFILHDDVQFIKQGWIHRNRILLQGEPHYLTVPLKPYHQDDKILSVQITQDPNSQWKSKHLKLLQRAYQKAPYYNAVFPWIADVIQSAPPDISTFATHTLFKTCEYLSIQVPILSVSKHFESKLLKSENKVIDLCKQVSATEYFNLSGGIQLYDPRVFQAENIKLTFIKMDPVEYPQQPLLDKGAPCVPNLSIIDVMMFNPPQAIQTFLKAFHTL